MATSVARIVGQAAAGRPVAVVRLEVGALRQVVPPTLVHAWGFVTDHTALEGARLEVQWVPARLRCECSHRWGLDGGELDVRCPRCGRPGVVVAGEEFRVVDIEVVEIEVGS